MPPSLSSAATVPILPIATKQGSTGVNKFFHVVKPPTHSLEDALTGTCGPEKTAEEDLDPDLSEGDGAKEEDTKATAVEKIQQGVFNHIFPQELYMTKEPSMVRMAKELGVHKDKMLKEELKMALMSHFLVQLDPFAKEMGVSTKDLYLSAPCSI